MTAAADACRLDGREEGFSSICLPWLRRVAHAATCLRSPIVHSCCMVAHTVVASAARTDHSQGDARAVRSLGAGGD